MDVPTFTSLLNDFAVEVGLTSDGDHTVYGYYRDFPFACSILNVGDPDPMCPQYGEPGLLVHFRHVRDGSSSPEGLDQCWEPPLAEMISDGTLKIESEDRITWVSFYKPYELLRAGTLHQVLDAVLAHLQTEGCESLSGTCHYCMEHQVCALTFEDDRVGQICDVCLEPYLAVREEQTTPTVRGLLLALFASVPGILYGAIAWAGCWLLYMATTNTLERLKIRWIPGLVLVAFMFMVSFGVGWTITWWLRSVRGRGDVHAGALGVAMSMLAIVLGEFVFGLIAALWLSGVLSISSALRFVTEYWAQLGFVQSLIRGGTALITIAVAGAMARPKLKRIPL